MITLGKNKNYIRFWPNPGVSFKIAPKRWLHICGHCGVGLLKPGEFRTVRPRRPRRR